ncbi:MAG: hypothetical protein ACRCXZ_02670 [Patescibacteria group bacterium]
MAYKVKFNDTTNINKSFYQAILEGVYIGKLMNLSIKDYPVFKTIKNMFRYTFSKSYLPTLKESEIRKIEDYVVVRDHMVKYFQLRIPYLANTTEVDQIRAYQNFSNFIESTKSFNEIELFYYDRDEMINDYQLFFKQLDSKMESTNKFNTEEGSALATRLRANFEDYLIEMFEEYKSRTREVFIIIHTPIRGKKVNDLLVAKDELDTKVSKTLSAIQELKISYQEVEGEHLDWLLHNFVSNTTNY